MKKIVEGVVLVVLINLFFQNGNAQTNKVSLNRCEKQSVKLQSEFKSRNRYFFFRETNFVKTRRLDRIIDTDGNVVIEVVMRSETRGDEYLFRKFHRLVIIENEIHEVICKIGKKTGKVIIYNFCGDKLKEIDMAADVLYDKYRF